MVKPNKWPVSGWTWFDILFTCFASKTLKPYLPHDRLAFCGFANAHYQDPFASFAAPSSSGCSLWCLFSVALQRRFWVSSSIGLVWSWSAACGVPCCFSSPSSPGTAGETTRRTPAPRKAFIATSRAQRCFRSGRRNGAILGFKHRFYTDTIPLWCWVFLPLFLELLEAGLKLRRLFFQGSMVAFHRARSWAQCMEDVCQCVWNAPAHSFDRVKHTPFYESCTAEFPRFPFFDHHLPNPFDFCDDPHSMVASRRELRTVRSVQRWSGWLRENQTSLATRFGITTSHR